MGRDFADQLLARLPAVRFVIPGSWPGKTVTVAAGLTGLLTAVLLSLWWNPAAGPEPAPAPETPPPMPLFQAVASEFTPVAAK